MCINCHADAFLYVDCKDIATANKDIEIKPQNSVHPFKPKLLINNGAITVIKPPERSGCKNNCLIENTGKVLVEFLGSANLKSRRPLAATPVEFPNSAIALSNHSSLKNNLEKINIPTRFHTNPPIAKILIGTQYLTNNGKFNPAMAVIISKSVESIPISR